MDINKENELINIERALNDAMYYYKGLGTSARQNITKSDIFKAVNLNSDISKQVFQRMIDKGIIFSKIKKKNSNDFIDYKTGNFEVPGNNITHSEKLISKYLSFEEKELKSSEKEFFELDLEDIENETQGKNIDIKEEPIYVQTERGSATINF